jgi:hypothetical protein
MLHLFIFHCTAITISSHNFIVAHDFVPRTSAALLATITGFLWLAASAQCASAAIVHPDIVEIRNFTGRIPGGVSWADSYSVGNECYCYRTFDHNIGEIVVQTGINGLENKTRSRSQQPARLQRHTMRKWASQ